MCSLEPFTGKGDNGGFPSSNTLRFVQRDKVVALAKLFIRRHEPFLHTEARRQHDPIDRRPDRGEIRPRGDTDGLDSLQGVLSDRSKLVSVGDVEKIEKESDAPF